MGNSQEITKAVFVLQIRLSGFEADGKMLFWIPKILILEFVQDFQMLLI